MEDKKCEYCDEEFSGDKERLEHELEEHKDEMTGHSKDSKKKELNRLEQKRQTKKHNRYKLVQYSLASLLLIGLVAGSGYYAYQNLSSSGSPTINGSASVGETIHWHAPYEINVCGEQKVLEGGPHLAHTHGESKFHMEGTRTSKKQGTLGWIVNQLGGDFSNKGILGYEEPESCPDSDEPGSLTVKVNNQEIDNPENYVVQDGDFIKITYK